MEDIYAKDGYIINVGDRLEHPIRGIFEVISVNSRFGYCYIFLNGSKIRFPRTYYFRFFGRVLAGKLIIGKWRVIPNIIGENNG